MSLAQAADIALPRGLEISTLRFTDFWKTNPFVGVCGASGSGKTTLTKSLVLLDDFKRPISYTTRKQRLDEDTGEYFFVSDLYFDELLGDRFHYVDTAYGNRYAIDIVSVQKLHSKKIIPIKELHLSNIEKLKNISGYRPLVVELAGTFIERANRQEESHVMPKRSFPSVSFDPAYSSLQTLTTSVRDWVGLISLYDSLLVDDVDSILSEELAKNLLGYETVAPHFSDQERKTTRFFHDLTVDFWRSKIPPMRGSVLEIGPGHGWLRRVCTWNCARYAGVELSAKMASFADEPDKIWVGPLETFPAMDSTFDCIVGSLVDPCLTPNNLIHIRRLLKKSGKFVGTAPAGEWAASLRKRRGFRNGETIFNTPAGNAAVTSCCLDQKEIFQLFTHLGFSEVKVSFCSAAEGARDFMPPDVSVVVDSDGLGTPIIATWECTL